MDRSQRDLERQEKQLEADIKKAAKEGNKQVCALLAKNLVRLRAQKTRCQTVSSQIGAIGSKSKVIQANQKMAGAMATTTKVRSRRRRTAGFPRSLPILSRISYLCEMLWP